ncbi:hypothetical protein BDQ17DRAFT_1335281 [Cyathus striatus]|nr:hypothetical protein BDQ17DRAFT_1335281 [Cyathus striatus]
MILLSPAELQQEYVIAFLKHLRVENLEQHLAFQTQNANHYSKLKLHKLKLAGFHAISMITAEVCGNTKWLGVCVGTAQFLNSMTVNLGLLIVPAYHSFKQGPSNLVCLVLHEASANIVIATSMMSNYSPLLVELRVVLHTCEEAWKTQTQIASDARTLTLVTGDQLLFALPTLLNSLSSHCEV